MVTNDWDAEVAVSGGDDTSARKKLPCGMCGAMLNPDNLSFRMTTKMVRETLFHVSETMPSQKSNLQN